MNKLEKQTCNGNKVYSILVGVVDVNLPHGVATARVLRLGV